jgi:hypothetical protein
MCFDIKIIDMLSSPILLELERQKYMKTNLGAFLTVVLFFLLCMSMWFIGNDLVFRKKPFSYFKQNYNEIYPELNLTKIRYPFAFSIEDVNAVPRWLDEYFEVYIDYSVFQRDEHDLFNLINRTKIDLRRCNYSDFPTITKEKFDFSGFKSFYCLSGLDDSLMIKGSWNENEISMITFNLNMCDYDRNSSCKSKKEISDFVKENFISATIYYLDSILDVNNFTSPLRLIPNNVFTTLVPELSKNINFFVGEDQLVSDEGIFAEHLTYQNFLNMKYNALDSFTFNEKDKNLFSLSIYSYNVSTITFRNYLSITDILARVGGFMSIFSFAFKYLNSYLSDIEKNLFIFRQLNPSEDKSKISSFLENELNQMNQNNSNLSILKNFKVKSISLNLSKNENNSKLFFNMPRSKDILNLKNNKEVSTKEFANLSFFDKIYIIIWSKIFGRTFKIGNKKFNYLEQENKLCRFLDVKNIVNDLHIFEKFIKEQEKINIELMKVIK